MFSECSKFFAKCGYFGMNQLYFNKNNQVIKTSKIAIAYSFLLVAILWVSTIIEIVDMLNSNYFKLQKGLIMYCIDCICISATSGVGVFYSCCFGEKIIKTLKKMYKMEILLVTNKAESYFFMTVKIFLFVQLLVMAYDIYVWAVVFNGLQYSTSVIYLGYLVITTMQIKFTYIVMKIATRFKSLNNDMETNLNKLFECKRSFKHVKAHRSKEIIYLYNLSKLVENYHILCGIIGKIILYCGPQNLLLVIYIFEQLICSPFFGIMNSNMFHDLNTGTHFFMSYTLWAMNEIHRLIIFLWPCSYLEKQALKSRKLLSKYLDPTKHCYCAELETYMLKLSHSFSGISVLKLFDLNFSLAVQVFGAASTYLVIFIQF